MPDSYNENEIVKLKHLNEFARQLTNKIGTDSKPDRTFTRFTFCKLVGGGSSSQNWIDVTNVSEISMTTDQVYVSATNYSLMFRIGTPYDGVAPQILNIEAQNSSPTFASVSYSTSGVNANVWQPALLIGTGSIVPDQITFTVHFPASQAFNAFSKTFTVNITEPEGG